MTELVTQVLVPLVPTVKALLISWGIYLLGSVAAVWWIARK